MEIATDNQLPITNYQSPSVLVIGLGNPFLTDDGVGVRVAEEVERMLPAGLRSAVNVTEASVGGLSLMEMMVGYDRVILVDALLADTGLPPGSLRRLTLAELAEISPTQHSASAHDTSLVTALAAGRQMELPLPQEIVVLAVAVATIDEFSETPTPAVADAIPKAAAAVLAELHRFVSESDGAFVS